MVRRHNIYANIDWLTIGLFMVIIIFGWMNIYSANIMEKDGTVFDLSQRFGKQFIWIGAALAIGVVLFIVDAKFYSLFAYFLYIFIIILLAAVLLFGKEINGAKSWFVLGGFQLQPSEFAKPITALALARLHTSHGYQIKKFKDLLKAGIIILLPSGLILLQPDMGSATVFFALIFVLFREGFSIRTMILMAMLVILFFLTLLIDKTLILLFITLMVLVIMAVMNKNLKPSMIMTVIIAAIFGIIFMIFRLTESEFSLFTIGILALIPVTVYAIISSFYRREYNFLKIIAGMIISISFVMMVDFAMNTLLKEHQQHRIYVTLGLEDDPQGVGYNVNQSKIAIGSGGFSGKGYLKGTQTKLDFVPEHSTDFIFCTVGEEWGFLGTAFVIIMYIGLLLRLIFLAERQRSSFSRIYGYGLISILFYHFMVNIGMTIGLFPVIGIPLPFFSYGGSSLWAFSIFLFIFLRLDASRLELLS